MKNITAEQTEDDIMTDKKFFIIYGLIICILIIIATFCIIYLVKEQNKRTDYDELIYYDFEISYDDDNYCYEIFTNDKRYTIRESQLSIKYDIETHIVVYDNNYNETYNKAILFLGVKKLKRWNNG